MRLIDADALIAKLEDDAKHMEDNIAIMFTYAAINDIKHEPTVDAVEVVRCKDCKHWDMVDLHFHNNICSKLMRPCDESDFCSWAERRQDG